VPSPSRSERLLAICLLWVVATAAHCQVVTQPQNPVPAAVSAAATPAAAIATIAATAATPATPSTAATSPAPASRADAVADLVGRHPAGSIDSVASADAALADVSRERTLVEAEHVRSEQACAPVFFMTRCLDKAKERRRAALARLRPIEIEANAFKRRDRVAERDRLLEEKRLKAEQEATPEQRALKVRKPERPEAGTAAGDAGGPDKAADKPARPAPTNVRQPHVVKPDTHVIDAATQARNMASFDRKAAESLARQKEIAAKKAENERDRAKKRAELEAKTQAEAEAAKAPK
jgi:colicin import membrane protein